MPLIPKTLPVPWKKSSPKKKKEESSSEDDSDDDDSGSDGDTASGSGASGSGEDETSSEEEDSPPKKAAEPAEIPPEAATLDWYRKWKADKVNGRKAERDRDDLMKKRVPAERYTGAAAVWRALDGPGVKLLRASYLIELARDGGVLQRRQDLPDKAFIPLMQLQRSHADASSLITGFDGALPIVAVSACWITNTHADPRGQNLKIVGAYLAREVPKYKAVALDGGNGFDHVGIFWDWGSLYQPDPEGGVVGRTDIERTHFEGALNDMDLWFGHHGIVSLLVTKLPPRMMLKELKGVRKKARTYDESGWTYYEGQAAKLKQFVRARRHLHGASWQIVLECQDAKDALPHFEGDSDDGEENDEPAPTRPQGGNGGGGGDGGSGGSKGAKPVDKAERKKNKSMLERAAAWPVLSPAEFKKNLSSKQFLKPEVDMNRVANLYAKQCESQLGGLSNLKLSDGIDRTSRGVGRNQKKELLQNSQMRVGVNEAKLLGQSIGELCPRLANLHLDSVVGFGDAALKALCEGLSIRAALRGPPGNHLSDLSLDANNLTDVGLIDLAAAARKGAFRNLKSLSLSRNHLGAEGVIELASASRAPITPEFPNGSKQTLTLLTTLNLYRNRVGAEGCRQLASELKHGAFEPLTSLYLGQNGLGTEGCIALAKAAVDDYEDATEFDPTQPLHNLKRLHLFGNRIGRPGAIAIGKALHEWALRGCTEVVLDGNEISRRARRFVTEALQRREFARATLRQWRQQCVAARKQRAFGLNAQHRRRLIMPTIAQSFATAQIDGKGITTKGKFERKIAQVEW